MAAILGLGGCTAETPSNQQGGTRTAAAGALSNPCQAGTGTLSSAMPQSSGADEIQLDCFAWQEFVALNWRADPSKPGYPDPAAGPNDFGTDGQPVVWETYLEASQVFAGPLQGQWQAKRPAVKRLARTSKFGMLDLSDIVQAGSGHHWLTNQRGDITYYEVMMNRDEYEFITGQPKFDLTTAAGQLACATQPGKVISDGPPPPLDAPKRGGLTMPEGFANGWDDTDCEGNIRTYGDQVGAMEIKASWTPLPADHSLDYRYKTATAEILDPVTKTTRQVTVGLTGLHIARKRVGRHQWVWATFEHIDNSPDEAANNGWTAPALPANGNQKPSPGFTFFNPNCDAATNSYKCVHNAPPTPCGTPAIACNPYNAPMQITRLNPVGAAANQATAWFWSLLPANSVFNYYRLINVQWPQTTGNPLSPGQRIPLPQGNPMPKGAIGGVGQILANTTLESFQQKQAACMDCHANYAQISPPIGQMAAAGNGLRKVTPAQVAAKPYAADYSFLFVTETKR